MRKSVLLSNGPAGKPSAQLDSDQNHSSIYDEIPISGQNFDKADRIFLGALNQEIIQLKLLLIR